MALEGIHIIVHNSNGISNMDASSATGTFQDVLNVLKTGQPSHGVSLYAGNIYGTGQEIGLSLTEGGTPLTLSSLITSEFQDGTTGTLYALYPEPSVETITGFYLDGTEYKFEGGGGTAEGISTDQPSSPVAGSTYYDTTNKVIKVYNGTAWEEVGGGNVIAMTQAQYDALTPAEQADGKLRIITDAPSVEVGSPIVYCTQAEYDALPSSKTSDGKNYVIYE